MDHCCAAGKQVLNLLKTAKGQIESTIAMVEEDRYCIDIAKQILAVSALLKKANHGVIRNHLHTCVVDAMESNNSAVQAEKIDEVLTLLESYLAK